MRGILAHIILFAVTFSTVSAEYAQIERIQTRPLEYAISRTGMIDFRHTILLSFKTAGFIRHLNADEGFAVKAGDILAELDSTDLRANLAAAVSAKQQADAQLKRGESLYRQKSISAESLQELKASAQQASADLELIEYNLARSRIVAPFDAIIIARQANQNEFQNAGDPVFVIASAENNFIVRLDLTESEIAKITMGLNAVLTLSNGQQLTGVIGNIPAKAADSTGMFSIEIDFSGADDLIAGQWANVSLTVQSNEIVLPLPINALAAVENGQAVYVSQENQQFFLRHNKIVHRDNHYVYLHSEQGYADIVVAGWDRLLKQRLVD